MPKRKSVPPIHPGEYLREDVLPDTGLSVSAAAKALGISRQMLHGILAESKPLSAVMCLKVSKLFGSSPEMWLRLQSAYDLGKATQDNKVMERVARLVPLQQRQPKSPCGAASFGGSRPLRRLCVHQVVLARLEADEQA